MSLTSYRAAPPRVKPAKTGSAGSPRARGLCSNHDGGLKSPEAKNPPQLAAPGFRQPVMEQCRIVRPHERTARLATGRGGRRGVARGGRATSSPRRARRSTNPAKSDAEAVHDFRRAMKRWRALLRLFEPFVGEDGQAAARRGARSRRARCRARATPSRRSMRWPISTSTVSRFRRARSPGCASGSRKSGARPRRRSIADMRLRLASALDEAETTVERWPLHLRDVRRCRRPARPASTARRGS